MKNMKKVFAFVLALAMILTTYQPTTTYAATKAPTISAKKMTLQVGSQQDGFHTESTCRCFEG